MKKLDFKSANGRTGEKLRLTLLAIAVIVITILVNAIASLFPMKIDMTSEQLYSLSEQSEKILESINEDVSIIGLFDRYSLPSDDKYIEIIKPMTKFHNIRRNVIILENTVVVICLIHSFALGNIVSFKTDCSSLEY